MENSCNFKLGTNSFDDSKTTARKNTIWKPLAMNWFKLNFDGVAKGNPSLASIGGVIKDCKGNLVVRFTGGIGIHYSMTTESRALLKVIEIDVTLGIKNLHIEGDSKFVIESINHGWLFS